jgi:molecular chaperone DnaK (HSP70)
MHEALTVQQLEGLTEDLVEDTIKICAQARSQSAKPRQEASSTTWSWSAA